MSNNFICWIIPVRLSFNIEKEIFEKFLKKEHSFKIEKEWHITRESYRYISLSDSVLTLTELSSIVMLVHVFQSSKFIDTRRIIL